jgi:uncharacterized LabA/DUF88 family protein
VLTNRLVNPPPPFERDTGAFFKLLRGKTIKSFVIIDGSNFYHKVKRLSPNLHLTEFGYRQFFESITNDSCRILYCIGEVKRSTAILQNRLFIQQQKLTGSLRRQDIQIYYGFLLKSEGVYHEKGVDVKMAVEIVKGALKDEYDMCYLVSSDSDLIPAILEAKKVGKRVIYVAFKNQISSALYRNCREAIIIDKERIEQYVQH